MLTVGSLFAGIGGFDLGFERAGMRTLWQVEQNEFCRAHHRSGRRRSSVTWTVWQKGEPILTVVMLKSGVASDCCPPTGLGSANR